MYEYELHQMRSAELIRRAQDERLAREVVRARRAARRKTAEHATATAESHTHQPRRFRSTRTA
jgi:hypothetical protein